MIDYFFERSQSKSEESIDDENLVLVNLQCTTVTRLVEVLNLNYFFFFSFFQKNETAIINS